MRGLRKYSLAAFAIIASSYLCYTSHISGNEWVGVVGIVLGTHFAANVASTKFGGPG